MNKEELVKLALKTYKESLDLGYLHATCFLYAVEAVLDQKEKEELPKNRRLNLGDKVSFFGSSDSTGIYLCQNPETPNFSYIKTPNGVKEWFTIDIRKVEPKPTKVKPLKDLIATLFDMGFVADSEGTFRNPKATEVYGFWMLWFFAGKELPKDERLPEWFLEK